MIAELWAAGAWKRRLSDARVRGLAQDRIRALGLPPSPQLADLIDKLSQDRGRQIHLVPSHLRHLGMSGVWLDIGDRDLIAYETTASSRMQRYIICHEIGHMILNHPQLSAAGLWHRHRTADELAICVPTTYDAAMETEADAVAQLLLRQLASEPLPEHGTDLQSVAGRIAASLQRSR